MIIRTFIASAGFFLFSFFVFAAEPEGAMQAPELAARLSAKQEGNSYVRLRMTTPGGTKGALQLQIKSRASRAGTDLVYQVLFPKERKGEGVLLRRSGGRISGVRFTPPDDLHPLTATQLAEPLFGSDLSYEDVIDNFFAWEQQAIVGAEIVDHVNCQILESKPGKTQRSTYSSVRTWVDPRRLVPLRIEKFGEGNRLVRRIAITRILLDGDDSLPVNFTVRGPRGTMTELDGSRLKRGITFADAEFTAEGLKQLTAPRGAPE